MAKVCSVGCVGFLVEQTGACVLLGGLDLVFLVGGLCSLECFGVSVNLV